MEYKTSYEKTAKFFSTLKSKDSKKLYRTWQSKLQKKYDEKDDLLDIAKFISTRPGEFIRRFDSLFRRSDEFSDRSQLFNLLLETPGMKTKTLLELSDYYSRRQNGITSRLITSKDGKVTVLPELPEMNAETAELIGDVIVSKILKNINEKVTEKDLSGTFVMLDDKLKNIPIPKGSRTSNISIPKGIIYEIPKEDNIVRFYIHWEQQGDILEDLDLHAFLYKDRKTMVNIGFHTGLSLGDLVAHSGDVLDRPGKCAEYVDIDLKRAEESGFKYVIMDVYNYKDRGLDTLPAWGGFLTVPSVISGDSNWYPENVLFGEKLTSESSGVALMLVDICNRTVKILDVPMSGIPVNVDSNKQAAIVECFSTAPRISTYDIMKEYYSSRGATILNLSPEIDMPEVTQVITFEDISRDYVKILELIG